MDAEERQTIDVTHTPVETVKRAGLRVPLPPPPAEDAEVEKVAVEVEAQDDQSELPL